MINFEILDQVVRMNRDWLRTFRNRLSNYDDPSSKEMLRYIEWALGN